MDLRCDFVSRSIEIECRIETKNDWGKQYDHEFSCDHKSGYRGHENRVRKTSQLPLE